MNLLDVANRQPPARRLQTVPTESTAKLYDRLLIPSSSQHLAMLRAAGIVATRRDGQTIVAVILLK